jgi:hypothetical protein
MRMKKPVALLVLLLTLWSAFAFAAHSHSTSLDAAKCQVCVAAQSAAPAISFLSRTPVSFAECRVVLKPLALRQRLLAFALAVRPPPQN